MRHHACAQCEVEVELPDVLPVEPPVVLPVAAGWKWWWW
jgi:hypothetical protein